MIQFGHDESHLRPWSRKGACFQIDMHLKKNSPKGIAIDKIPIRRASELFGIVQFVFFSPEDLNIIKEGPAGAGGSLIWNCPDRQGIPEQSLQL